MILSYIRKREINYNNKVQDAEKAICIGINIVPVYLDVFLQNNEIVLSYSLGEMQLNTADVKNTETVSHLKEVLSVKNQRIEDIKFIICSREIFEKVNYIEEILNKLLIDND